MTNLTNETVKIRMPKRYGRPILSRPARLWISLFGQE